MKAINKTGCIATFILGALALFSCNNQTQVKEESMIDNLLLKEWTGPYGGVYRPSIALR